MPDPDDWGGWVEVWCREDNGNISCVPDFMRAYVEGDVTPEGWLKTTYTGFSTPYTLARWVGPFKPPWSGQGFTPDNARKGWLELLHKRLYPERAPIKPEPSKPIWVKPKTGAHLYFIESAFGPIKIGVSSDPAQRLKGLQTSHPVKLSLLAVVHGAGPLEGEYHRKFDEHRLEGEWFSPAPDILAEIARLNSEQSA